MSTTREIKFKIDLEKVSPEHYQKLLDIIKKFTEEPIKTCTYNGNNSTLPLNSDQQTIVRWFPKDL